MPQAKMHLESVHLGERKNNILMHQKKISILANKERRSTFHRIYLFCRTFQDPLKKVERGRATPSKSPKKKKARFANRLEMKLPSLKILPHPHTDLEKPHQSLQKAKPNTLPWCSPLTVELPISSFQNFQTLMQQP